MGARSVGIERVENSRPHWSYAQEKEWRRRCLDSHWLSGSGEMPRCVYLEVVPSTDGGHLYPLIEVSPVKSQFSSRAWQFHHVLEELLQTRHCPAVHASNAKRFVLGLSVRRL